MEGPRGMTLEQVVTRIDRLIREGRPDMARTASRAGSATVVSVLALVVFGLSCRSNVVDPEVGSCVPTTGDAASVGFYAHFEPVSYSENPDPASPGFTTHMGYEADLLTALEAMEEGRVSFVRQPIADWPGIWLLSATPRFDMVGGGITILESRTLDSAGRRAIAFTSGHITFRQSLLTRLQDVERFASYGNLTSDVQVGVLLGTTGEARFLQIAGIADGDGVLARGTRIQTPQGDLVADGTAAFTITAAFASAELEHRTRILPPSADMPQVVYRDREEDLLTALRDGTIDAVARGEIGNIEGARASGGNLAVAAVDSLTELGGFSLDADAPEMLACIDRKLEWLTDERRIGFAEWRADPGVFLSRAVLWNQR